MRWKLLRTDILLLVQNDHRQSQKAVEKLKNAIEKRHTILTKLHRHQVAFAGQLRTEAGR